MKASGLVLSPVSITVAVGHDEEPLASVGCPSFRRAKDSDRSSVTHSPKPRQERLELACCVAGDVLSEDTTRPAASHDAEDLVDKEAIVGGAEALPCNAVRLARVARQDAIHCSAPWSSVEGGKVRPHRRRSQVARFHARDQCRGGIGFPLHVSDADRSRHGDVDPEAEASDSGAELEQVVGM